MVRCPGRHEIRWAIASKYPWEDLDCKGFSRLAMR